MKNIKKIELAGTAGLAAAVAATLAIMPTPAWSGGASLDSFVDGVHHSTTMSSYNDFVSQRNAGIFDDINNLYKSSLDPASAVLNLSGTDVIATTDAGSTSIVLSVPDIGFVKTFSEGSRSASQKAVETYLKHNYKSLVSKIMTQAPLNSIAGSPTSGLLFTSATTDYNFGQGRDFTPSGGIGISENRPNMSFGFGTSTIGSTTINTYSVPLGYTWNFENGYGLVTSLPISYVETVYNNTTTIPSYQASLGLGVRVPFNHYIDHENRWDLTPIFRIGASGSEQDYSSIGVLYSGGLLSEYYFDVGGLDLSLRNMVAYYTTVPVYASGISTELFGSVDNYLFKNGIRVASPLSIPGVGDHLFGRPVTASVYYNNTSITGSNLFVQEAHEFGFDIGLLGKKASADSSWVASQVTENELRVGFGYTHADGVSNAVNATMGFSF